MIPTCEADIEILKEAEELAESRGCDSDHACWNECVESALTEVQR